MTKVIIRSFFVALLGLVSFSCFLEPKKDIFVEPFLDDQVVTFRGLVRKANLEKKFRSEHYYISDLSVNHAPPGRVGNGKVWHVSRFGYLFTNPDSIGKNYSSYSELPNEIRYGQTMLDLEELLEPKVLVPGERYLLVIQVVGVKKGGEKVLFWIRSYFEIPNG